MGKLTAYFVRHGTTVMNQLGLFCGSTDALLAREGWQELENLKENYDYPEVERVYSSPAIRCIETASALYPGMTPVTKEGLWEVDFGEDEGAPASDFLGTPFFDTWLAQEPDCAFRGGESILEARFRVMAAMTRIVKECRDSQIKTIAIVAHGAILARLMEGCLVPKDKADAFVLCPNGMGLKATLDTKKWFTCQEMQFEAFFPEGAPRLKAEDSPYFGRKQ
ncbi:MAG: histidine phosphatase family protein [Eubacterium sp.]|nr:histidine phosphatase family protein [Eubacterium sp.]